MATKRAQNSVKTTPKKRGKPFLPGNIFRWPSGVSGNPGGRPKSLSDAYRAWLELPSDKNPDITNAQAIACAQGFVATIGDVQAAKEIRQATEGDTQNVNGGVAIVITYANDHSDAAPASPSPAADQTGA